VSSGSKVLSRAAMTAVLIVLCGVAAPSLAQVNFSFGIEVAPPPPPVEEVYPVPRPGFVWAPPYWAWDGERHVRVPGHWMQARPDSYWVPDGWEHHVEETGAHWHFAPGRWERAHGHWEHDRGRHEHGERRDHDDER
jgi:hypothetical protein